MADRKLDIGDVDAMLARWRKSAGADWEAAFRTRLEDNGRRFEAKGDPLDAWEALLLTRALGEAPPQWALDYLVISAAGIHGLRAASMQGDKIKPAMIGRALDLVSQGAGTAFPGPDEFEWIAFSMQVRDAIKGGNKETLAIQYVAEENGVSQSKVRESWKRLQATAPDLL